MDARWVFSVFFKGIEESSIGVREPPNSNGNVGEGVTDLSQRVYFRNDKKVLRMVLDGGGYLEMGQVCVKGNGLIRRYVIEKG